VGGATVRRLAAVARVIGRPGPGRSCAGCYRGWGRGAPCAATGMSP